MLYSDHFYYDFGLNFQKTPVEDSDGRNPPRKTQMIKIIAESCLHLVNLTKISSDLTH